MSGKGSKPRPYSVDKKTFDKNWNAIFSKVEKQQEKNQKDKNKQTK